MYRIWDWIGFPLDNHSTRDEGLCSELKKLQVKCSLDQNNIKYSESENFQCEDCIYGKMHRTVFHQSTKRANKCGEIINADVCGKMEIPTVGGSQYFVLFKDDYSNYRKVFFIKNKSEVLEHFKFFVQTAKKTTVAIVNFSVRITERNLWIPTWIRIWKVEVFVINVVYHILHSKMVVLSWKYGQLFKQLELFFTQKIWSGNSGQKPSTQQSTCLTEQVQVLLPGNVIRAVA